MKTKIDFDNPSISSAETQHFNFLGGVQLNISDQVKLSPQFMLNWTQNSPVNLEFNVNLNLHHTFITGISLRNGGNDGKIIESIDFIIGTQIRDQILLGFAYDLGLSSLNAYHSGSVELVLQYRWLPRKKTSEFTNPRFF